MSDRERQAICCICGTVRTCKRARNHREENYWMRRPVNLDWSRETGDLKCQECGKVTTHALLHPEGDWAADHAEMLQHVALGGSHPRFAGPLWDEDRNRVRDRYRQSNFPRNPYVSHKWWKSDENEAREAGQQWFLAMCGEPVAVPERKVDGTSIDDYQAPTQLTDPDRAEHENLDVDTGLTWTQDGVCVNCLRVRNDWLFAKRRKLMAEWFEYLHKHPEKVPDDHVEKLIETFEVIRCSIVAKQEADR